MFVYVSLTLKSTGITLLVLVLIMGLLAGEVDTGAWGVVAANWGSVVSDSIMTRRCLMPDARLSRSSVASE